MGSWPRGIGAITLFVEDLDAAKQFYREGFGLPVKFEDSNSAVFDFGNERTPASEVRFTTLHMSRVPMTWASDPCPHR